jgi:ParB-like chromosome segregation protein Spo0J
MIKTVLKISEIKPNPQNPRIIRDDKFKKLVQSIKDFPEMLDTREIVVNKDHVILGGNMRFKAAKEAGLKEVPVKIVDWDEDKQREFIAKDNANLGEWDWDILANDGWEMEDLKEWGVDLGRWSDDIEQEEPQVVKVSCPTCGSKVAEDKLR